MNTETKRSTLSLVKQLEPHPADLIQPPPPPTARIEEVRAERRRRTDTSQEYNTRLSVNEGLMDRHKYAYRFINDTGGRLHELTVNDDWDVVKDPRVKSDNDNQGAPVRKLVGSNQDGSPIYAYLCRKLKTYYVADRKSKAKRTDDLEAELKRGVVRPITVDGVKEATASTADPTVYIPEGGISISHAPRAKVTQYQP